MKATVTLSILLALGVAIGPAVASQACGMGKSCGSTATNSRQVNAEARGPKTGAWPASNPAAQLADALKALDAVAKAVDTGDKKAAHDALALTKKLIADAKKTITQCIRAKIANDTCPIMGGAIDLAKVTDKVVRKFNGKTVAFCCPKCLPTWDKLSNADKHEKLNEIIAQKVQKAQKTTRNPNSPTTTDTKVTKVINTKR